ncbi:MAG: hypothetical protein COC16_04925 [Lutibacter sp.]|nr:MAG: hypothetical protein COC16_04925 [Lutibacter sp.]
MCEIEYVKAQKSLQITVGMFIDDIEFTLNKNHNTSLNLATKNENIQIDNYYSEYLKKHFKVIVNNTPKSFMFIGKEYDDDIVRFYLEITDINELKSVEVINTSLLRDFENQQNIIKINANNTHKTFYLNRKNDKSLLNF